MELRSIDPARNRQRRYSLAIQYRVDGGGDLMIAWGRLGSPARHRSESFDSADKLRRRYAALLSRRRRHGYYLLEESPAADVPPSPTLDAESRYITMLQKNGYLGVFDTRMHAFVIRDVAPDVNPDALLALARQSA